MIHSLDPETGKQMWDLSLTIWCVSSACKETPSLLRRQLQSVRRHTDQFGQTVNWIIATDARRICCMMRREIRVASSLKFSMRYRHTNSTSRWSFTDAQTTETLTQIKLNVDKVHMNTPPPSLQGYNTTLPTNDQCTNNIWQW
jgi:hypothetical protein